MEKEQKIRGLQHMKRELQTYKTLRILHSLDEKIQKLQLSEDEKELVEEAFEWLYTQEKLKNYGLN